MSLLGRGNGILYFVPLVLIAVSRLGFMAGAGEIFPITVMAVSYLLLLSTVASIIDRGIAPLLANRFAPET